MWVDKITGGEVGVDTIDGAAGADIIITVAAGKGDTDVMDGERCGRSQLLAGATTCGCRQVSTLKRLRRALEDRK